MYFFTRVILPQTTGWNGCPGRLRQSVALRAHLVLGGRDEILCVTDPSDDALAAFPPPRVTGPERPPGAVVAAAVATWTMASITAAGALGLGLPALLLGGPILDLFEGEHLRLYVVGVVLVVIALAAAGDVLAYLVFRRHRWARWAL